MTKYRVYGLNLIAIIFHRYRILLEWQLDAAQVDYRDDWEEWGWMNSIVRECQDNGKGTALNDTMLDCVVEKFIHLEINLGHFSFRLTDQNSSACLYEATALTQCSKHYSSGSDPIRVSLESLIANMKVIGAVDGKYIYNTFK